MVRVANGGPIRGDFEAYRIVGGGDFARPDRRRSWR
jgi:hypothetical protein